jgi:hypothetical protein
MVLISRLTSDLLVISSSAVYLLVTAFTDSWTAGVMILDHISASIPILRYIYDALSGSNDAFTAILVCMVCKSLLALSAVASILLFCIFRVLTESSIGILRYSHSLYILSCSIPALSIIATSHGETTKIGSHVFSKTIARIIRIDRFR